MKAILVRDINLERLQAFSALKQLSQKEVLSRIAFANKWSTSWNESHPSQVLLPRQVVSEIDGRLFTPEAEKTRNGEKKAVSEE